VDNSTGEPDRYWFETELHSLVGANRDWFASLGYNIGVGRIPFWPHNSLLMNDEMLAVVISKNSIYFGTLSNLNIQAIYGFNDISTFFDADARMYAVYASADYRRTFSEATCALVQHTEDASRDSHFAGISHTKPIGPIQLGRSSVIQVRRSRWVGCRAVVRRREVSAASFRTPRAGNRTRRFLLQRFLGQRRLEFDWGGNFNRLTSTFEVNPLVRISLFPPLETTWGAGTGVQMFRHHEDESLIPEVAFEDRGGSAVWGVGLRYLRKTGPRTYVQALAVANFNRDSRFERDGIFLSYFVVF